VDTRIIQPGPVITSYSCVNHVVIVKDKCTCDKGAKEYSHAGTDVKHSLSTEKRINQDHVVRHQVHLLFVSLRMKLINKSSLVD
jgi:hypothetical protein